MHITKTAILYFVLRITVIIIMILQLYNRNYTDVFLCILTLILFMIPSIVDKKLNISLPNTLEVIIILFIFASQILGEIRNYYVTFPYWDSMLHTINGFLMSAIGFSLIDILNRIDKFHIKMTPVFVALVAFCFSVTIGVMWEFFEFGIDNVLNKDMQKDKIVHKIATIELDETKSNIPIVIKNIESTTIVGEINGEKQSIVINNGYLDIGIFDTMKDLIVNCIGALVFSILGMIYIKSRGKRNFTKIFIPVMKNKNN